MKYDTSAVAHGSVFVACHTPVSYTHLSGGGQVLNDAASQADVDQLHAFADAEYRKLFSQKSAKEEKLKPVQSGIHGAGSLIFLMKKIRVNVAASGKNKGIEGGGGIRKKSGERLRRIDGELFWQCIGQRPADGAPVSYTHLDVYKRQGFLLRYFHGRGVRVKGIEFGVYALEHFHPELLSCFEQGDMEKSTTIPTSRGCCWQTER